MKCFSVLDNFYKKEAKHKAISDAKKKETEKNLAMAEPHQLLQNKYLKFKRLFWLWFIYKNKAKHKAMCRIK